MTPLHYATLTMLLFGGLAVYGIRRVPTRDVRSALRTVTRDLVVLGLGSLALLLADPADVPTVLRAVVSRF
ncbi:hypothetical protein L0F81_22260 [Streptomyces tricolor]|uniref:Uncharacterized protein n=1 Tax=Streptomyces tricolor TaxID=68277 RepID=A0ABS9JKD2_9ACTN|nr:hypothetical protein [Streptomyces tricolor]MCG0065986.1 hypothetical protein [Streptomyces tricolor]